MSVAQLDRDELLQPIQVLVVQLHIIVTGSLGTKKRKDWLTLLSPAGQGISALSLTSTHNGSTAFGHFS